QALVLDLTDPLPRHVERAADLVEGPWLLAVEPLAELEHRSLARRERAENRPERVAPERPLRRLVRKRRRLVGEEVAELGLVVVPHRLLERHGSLRGAANLLHLVEAEVEVAGDLRRRRLAGE